MLKPTGGATGRCLFFFASLVDEKQIGAVVLVYKKGSTEAPAKVMMTVQRHMEENK